MVDTLLLEINEPNTIIAGLPFPSSNRLPTSTARVAVAACANAFVLAASGIFACRKKAGLINGRKLRNSFKIIGEILQEISWLHVIQDDLKIELVDEMTSKPDEKIFDEVAPLINRKPHEIKIPNKLLIKLIQSGDQQARQDLCVKNCKLVEKFAKYYCEKIFSSQLTFEDLVQEGYIGMLKAAEKFDFAYETQFSTYATPWINQAITRAIADTGLLNLSRRKCKRRPKRSAICLRCGRCT